MGDKWSYLDANLTIPRCPGGCTLDANKENIYAFSGNTYITGLVKSIERYNFKDNKWYLLENVGMPHPFLFGNCILYPVDNNNIYCIGGSDLFADMYNYVQIFNPSDNSFEVENLNVARDNFGIGLYHDNCLLVWGGWIGASAGATIDTTTIEGLNCNLTLYAS